MSASPQGEKKCDKCESIKPLTEFRPIKNSAILSKKCASCLDQAAEWRREDRKRKRAEAEEAGGAEEDAWKIDPESPVKDLDDFLEELQDACDREFKLMARVETGPLAPVQEPDDMEARAKAVASHIGRATLWRWNFTVKAKHKRSQKVTFSFTCAQSEGRQKEKKPAPKPRARLRAARYPCRGWLHIEVTSGNSIMDIKIKHAEDHEAYVDISLPDQWKEYVEKEAGSKTPGQIWCDKRADEQRLLYKEKAVYYWWLKVSRTDWKLDTDPLESARRYIIEHGQQDHVTLLEIESDSDPLPAGTKVLAFQVSDFVKLWAAHTRELAMDSTFGTNRSNCELFAAVAGAQGSGIPIALCLIHTTKEAGKGAKQEILTRFLRQLKALGFQPEFTLTDKDWSEINVMRTVWPESKHQLCFWHLLKAVKTRLTRNKVAPAAYNARGAQEHFSFIQTSFVPAAQQSEDEKIDPPPEKPILRVHFLFQGRTAVITDAIPKICLPVRRPRSNSFDLEALVMSIGEQCEEERGDESDEEHFFSKAARDEDYMRKEDEDGYAIDGGSDLASDNGGSDLGDEEDDLPRQVEDLATEPDKDEDSAADQEWEADPDEPTDPEHINDGVKVKDPSYMFCPPAHRLTILRLLAKHASQHPLLPERHGEGRTSELLWCDAITEMYRHCEANRLCEVWAYLWNAWYCPKRWVLWTRAAHAQSIPAYRTTMIVESLWRNLKRLTFQAFNRPPLDLATYTIITKVLPPYRGTLSHFLL